mgnify:CR=1 FL=1
MCRPYDKKRVYAAFKKIMPEYDGIFVSEDISVESYMKRAENEEWIHVLVGDIQRMILYPKKGWQIEMAIPDEVIEAYNKLISLGYDKYILNNF